jgi:hypothetical protein
MPELRRLARIPATHFSNEDAAAGPANMHVAMTTAQALDRQLKVIVIVCSLLAGSAYHRIARLLTEKSCAFCPLAITCRSKAKPTLVAVLIDAVFIG